MKAFLKRLGRILLPFLIWKNSLTNLGCMAKDHFKKDGQQNNSTTSPKQVAKRPIRKLKKSKSSVKLDELKKMFIASRKKAILDQSRKAKVEKVSDKDLPKKAKEENVKDNAFPENAKKKPLKIEKRKINEFVEKQRIKEFNQILESINKEESTQAQIPESLAKMEKNVPVEPVLPSWMKTRVLHPVTAATATKGQFTPAFIMKAVTGSLALGIYTQLIGEGIKFFDKNPDASLNDFIQEKRVDNRFKSLLAAGLTCSTLCINSENVINLFSKFY